MQVAKGLDAFVLAGVATNEQSATAMDAGADKPIILSESFAPVVRQTTGGRGVDVVLDPLGDWLFDEALRALAPEGRILIVGFAAGAIPEIKANRLLLRNASAIGVAWGAFLDVEPTLMRTTAESLNEMARSGIVDPRIAHRFRFEQIPEALLALSRGEIPGKAIATLTA